MQYQGRFGEMKLNKVIFCCLFVMFLSVSTGGYAAGLVATESYTNPSQVRLEFALNDTGGLFVLYRLIMQAKNKKPRSVTTISSVLLDKDFEMLGNCDEDCRVQNKPDEVGQTGQCSRIVKTNSNRLVHSFSQLLWTDIVNSELETFERIKSCIMPCYRYGKNS